MTNKELELELKKEGHELRMRRVNMLLSAREIMELSNNTITLPTIYSIEKGNPVSHNSFVIYKHTIEIAELINK